MNITRFKKNAITQNILPRRMVNFMRADASWQNVKLLFVDASVFDSAAQNSAAAGGDAEYASFAQKYQQALKNLAKK